MTSVQVQAILPWWLGLQNLNDRQEPNYQPTNLAKQPNDSNYVDKL